MIGSWDSFVTKNVHYCSCVYYSALVSIMLITYPFHIYIYVCKFVKREKRIEPGISVRAYREMIRSDVTIHFTCTRCKRSQEETISGPRDSTHIESLDTTPQYGEFDISIILGGVSGSNTCSLNATYIIETSDREGQTDRQTDTTGEETDPPPTHNLTASFDVTRSPVGDEPEAIEVSLQERALEEHILPDVPVTYKIIEQGSQRGKRKLIDTDYLQCRDFLVGDIRVDEGRHLIFSTPNQLRILQQARRWFCDGTFKILAKPFQQLWSIHAFVTKGESFKQVPLVFCLMSRRKDRDYVAIFQKLKEILHDVPQVQSFVVDFEKAIRNEFPNTIIKGCAFHFGQAVWRKVQELGLRTTYSKRGPEYRYIRSLMALPFLPWRTSSQPLTVSLPGPHHQNYNSWSDTSTATGLAAPYGSPGIGVFSRPMSEQTTM
ncbi:uncharacterized protein LOC125669439 isoform X2 [Ostrea edulis]|uniref:uncharacterized protein LOC125669439 isoform X2 n=2 Tax=Ostrea edulis TaxID=37623 RepID=UPI0024AE905A|nr:uncharacterized protein LOC125669439 isoform X2 [Ostrea edulis]